MTTIPVPELVRDALDFHAGHVGRAAAQLTAGLDMPTALRVALLTVAQQRRELADLDDELNGKIADLDGDLGDHERRLDRAMAWLQKHPSADPEGELEAILDAGL